MHIYIHTHTHTHTHTHNTHTHTQTYIYIYICIYVYMYIYRPAASTGAHKAVYLVAALAVRLAQVLAALTCRNKISVNAIKYQSELKNIRHL
jgi:hypothetical protein